MLFHYVNDNYVNDNYVYDNYVNDNYVIMTTEINENMWIGGVGGSPLCRVPPNHFHKLGCHPQMDMCRTVHIL